MIGKSARTKTLLGGAAALSFGTLLGYGLHAAAEGGPTAMPLFYGGNVASKNGTPLEDTHAVSVSLFSAASGGTALCSTPSLSTAFTAGRFRVELPSGAAGCREAVANNPDTWVELTVDGTIFPRAKVGAVPYAVEADHAKAASTVTGTQADTLAQLGGSLAQLGGTVTQLGTSVTSVQADVNALKAATPVMPTAPSFKMRFLSYSDAGDKGCGPYSAATNSTVCQCLPGEIIVSAGAWAGLHGSLSASRLYDTPGDGANESDRARSWTFACVDASNNDVQCQDVQAICLKL